MASGHIKAGQPALYPEHARHVPERLGVVQVAGKLTSNATWSFLYEARAVVKRAWLRGANQARQGQWWRARR
ncbi:hypothetical protein [Candidatus Aalborgicola defluviihabitans]|uniref:hypothetical protein n=1 Tax=Candidatus Aalborgicola defluviihabitans TaxID=3386187 RepID=UPI0039B854E6